MCCDLYWTSWLGVIHSRGVNAAREPISEGRKSPRGIEFVLLMCGKWSDITLLTILHYLWEEIIPSPVGHHRRTSIFNMLVAGTLTCDKKKNNIFDKLEMETRQSKSKIWQTTTLSHFGVVFYLPTRLWRAPIKGNTFSSCLADTHTDTHSLWVLLHHFRI